MRKTIQISCTAIAALAMLVLTGCSNSAALKTAVEEANNNLPTPLATIGQATSLSFDEKTIQCEVEPAVPLAGLQAADLTILGKYVAVELLRNLPDIMNMAVEDGISLNCTLKGEGAEPVAVEVSADELKALQMNFSASGGQVAPILLPLYNQEITKNAPVQICEGLTIKSVKLKDGKESFFIDVDDDKVKFDDFRNNIAKNQENVDEKVKLANMNLSVLFPLLQELNYETIFRYSAKGGKETYMEISAEEIKDILTKGEAADAEKAD